MASPRYRNPCIRSNRCLSAAKFIGFSAISQSYRRSGRPFRRGIVPPVRQLPRVSLPPLPGRRRHPLEPRSQAALSSHDPAEFLWKLSDIHICPLLHQKFQARPRSARESSLSVIKDSQPLTISAALSLPLRPLGIHPLQSAASLRAPPSAVLFLVPLTGWPSSTVRKAPLRPFFGIRFPIRVRPLASASRSHGHPSRRVLRADLD